MIKPDLQCENREGLDDETFTYYEDVDDQGYYYEIYAVVDGKRAAIVVWEASVHVDFVTGENIATNITPGSLFPERTSLNWKHLARILVILATTGCEGKYKSREEMDKVFHQWLDSDEGQAWLESDEGQDYWGV